MMPVRAYLIQIAVAGALVGLVAMITEVLR